MTRRFRIAVTCALVAIATPTARSSAHAQAVAAPSPAPAAGPRFENLRAGYAPDHSSAGMQLAAAKGPLGSKNNGKIGMIVGGAALVGGLIVGDDAGYAIAIGGLIVGLLGLWTYLA